ncbi:unnamed protein product [Mytilus edulis]|uniref:Uncharacterized protein n=1 Tax=Mytilus edulis TaxID=6550 RepID=A0A8S3QF72_MYTED|nr:unnamed protein product [Mytilus edulis]
MGLALYIYAVAKNTLHLGYTYVTGFLLPFIKEREENNLELYLKDLFDEECKFKTEEGEEDFIREGVKTIVDTLVEKILSDYYDMIQNDDQDIYKRIRQDEENLNRDGINCIKCSTNDILKVGSYNEGTRNKFPDEFDFIFPVFRLEPTRGLNTADFDELLTKIQKDILPPTLSVSGQKSKNTNKKRRPCSVYFSNRQK